MAFTRCFPSEKVICGGKNGRTVVHSIKCTSFLYSETTSNDIWHFCRSLHTNQL